MEGCRVAIEGLAAEEIKEWARERPDLAGYRAVDVELVPQNVHPYPLAGSRGVNVRPKFGRIVTQIQHMRIAMRELENGRRSLKLKTQIFPLGSVSLVAVAPAPLHPHRPPLKRWRPGTVTLSST